MQDFFIKNGGGSFLRGSNIPIFFDNGTKKTNLGRQLE